MENRPFLLINLNQMVNKAELAERRRERNRWLGFTLMFLIFIGLGYGLYFITDDLNNLIDARETRIEQVISDTKALQHEGIELSKKDIESLHKLEGKRIQWATKFRQLADLTPEDMAIIGLHYRQNNLIISAISRVYPDVKDFTTVEKFIEVLKNDEVFSADFSDIKFISSDREISRSQEIVSFRVEARVKSSKKIKPRRGI